MNFCEDTRLFFEERLSEWCGTLPLNELSESMRYSLQGGGKRFRPILILLTAEAFGVAPSRVAGWALAVELVHTYSLIHDDLPCMDDDDLRRGLPTNHKKFGEALALLAGDALMSEAFGMIAEQHPALCAPLVKVLASACGVRGMVCGQVSDLASKTGALSYESELEMQNQKTGALIRASIQGAAIVCGLPSEKVEMLCRFGSHLGLAFQLRDDLLDSSSLNLESGSFPALIGIDQTAALLGSETAAARTLLDKLGLSQTRLHRILEFNFERRQ